MDRQLFNAISKMSKRMGRPITLRQAKNLVRRCNTEKGFEKKIMKDPKVYGFYMNMRYSRNTLKLQYPSAYYR